MSKLAAILIACLSVSACHADDVFNAWFDSAWEFAGRAGGAAPELWTPVDLGTNLLVWLDAADTSTLWADTNATTQATFLVARWDDKSGNDRDWYYVGGYPYIYDSGIRGGKTNALRHATSQIWTGTSGMVFVVGRQIQPYSAWGIMNLAKIPSAGSHTPFNTTTGYDSFMRTTRPSYTTPRNLANNGATPGAYALFSAVYTGTRGEIWFDGTRAYDAAATFQVIAATNQYLLAGLMVEPLTADANHQLNEVVMTTLLSPANRVLLEGYMAHNNGTQAYLPTNHLYYAAPPYKATSPELWTPADAIGLSAWHKLSDASTLTLNGTNITRIADQSGNGRHLDASLAVSPYYDSADGSAVYSGLESRRSLMLSPDGLVSTNSFIVAVYSTTNSGTAGSAFVYISDATLGDPELRLGSGAAGLNMYWYYNGGYAVNTTTASSQKQIITASFSGDVRADLYVNGNAITNGTRAGAWSAINTVTVGSNRAGRLYEYIAVTGSTADRQKAEGYAAHKHGFTASLPADHPYKSAPPYK